MKKILFIFVLLLGFCLSLSARAEEPLLSKLTCEEYWDYHKKINDTKSDKREENSKQYFSELAELWNYHVKKFKKDYPDLNYPSSVLAEVKDFKGQPYYIMVVYQACEHRTENMPQKVGDRLQETLYKLQLNELQKARARENGCDFIQARKNKTINTEKQDEVGYLCVDDGWKSRKSKELKDNKKEVELCLSYSDAEKCYNIPSNNENGCLWQFGSCQKNNEAKCGWSHTDKSLSCTKKAGD